MHTCSTQGRYCGQLHTCTYMVYVASHFAFGTRCMYVRTCTLRVKITCPKSRVLLSSFAASFTRIYCARARTTVEDHDCTGQGKHATRMTTQRFSRPMPLLLLYRAPSFGCSSFFVHRGLCKNRSIDVRGRTQCYM